MPTACDVAQDLIDRCGAPIEGMKLQKLTVYVQWWNVAAGRGEAFPDRIEAWADGPVIPDLWQKHRSQYFVSSISGADSRRVETNASLADTVKRVLDHYGARSGDELSEMMHNEDPWINARKRARADPGQRSNERISPQEAGKYYVQLGRRFKRAAPSGLPLNFA